MAKTNLKNSSTRTTGFNIAVLRRRPRFAETELRAAGFTIVETMIVLAVTGMMFVSAVLLVSGKQNKTEFMTAINDVRQQIQQTVNETASGYFPNSGNFTCTAGTPPQITTNSSNPSQGTNSGCMFLGKVMQFSPKDLPNEYDTYGIAGNRLTRDAIPQQVTQLAQAYPVSVPQLTTHAPLENGLQVVKMQYVDSSGGNGDTDGVGFLSTLGSYTGCGGNLCSGAQGLQLYAITGTKVGITNSQNVPGSNMETAIDATIRKSSGGFKPVDHVTLCFQSGTTTNQVGIVTIGGSNSAQAVNLQIGTACP